MENLKRFKKQGEEGQSLVEFALILPLLLILLLGIIQFGIIFSSQIALTNAAREGARVGAVGSSELEIFERVSNSIGGHVFLPALTNSNIDIETSSTVGEEIEVSIKDVRLKLFVPIPDMFLPNNEMILSAKASMRLEKIPD